MAHEFILPRKPAYITNSEWRAYLKSVERDGSIVCARIASGKCKKPCSSKLEWDHVQSRARGGEHSLANGRLICATGSEHANRNRGAGMDPKWTETFWFDHYDSFIDLRKTQKVCGPDLVAQSAELFTVETDKLLSNVHMFVLGTGAGKTVLVGSLLLAINAEVLKRVGKQRRVGRCLYLVSQVNLGQQVEAELRTDLTKFRLSSIEPKVRLCERSGDIDSAWNTFDFTIACPQTLWETNNQPRSTSELTALLAHYDTIVFDECDWAENRVAEIAKLARNSIKIGLTATPVTASGEIRKSFVIATVVGYHTVFALDRCVKPFIQDWDKLIEQHYIKAVKHKKNTTYINGEKQHLNVPHFVKLSHAGHFAAVVDAVHEASLLELRMHDQMPDDWYSPHIVVRCPSIPLARELQRWYTDWLAKHRLELTGEGWDSTILYGGEVKKYIQNQGKLERVVISKAEQKLAHKPGSPKVHPWMIAKTNKGRCTTKSCRVLFVVEMGIRGVNNWTCLSAVDLKASNSMPDQLQFWPGRACRLPEHLKKYLDNQKYLDFLHPRYYWVDYGDGIPPIRNAITLLYELEQRVADSGIVTWSQLLNEDIGELPSPKERQVVDDPFGIMDKMLIDNKLGEELISSGEDLGDWEEVTDEDLGDFVKEATPDWSDTKRKKAREHIRRLIEDDEYRSSLGAMPTLTIEKVVSSEQPREPEDYGVEELRVFVRSNPIDYPESIRSTIDERLVKKDKPTVHQVGLSLQKENAKRYQPLSPLFRVSTSNSKDVKDSSWVAHLTRELLPEIRNMIPQHRQPNEDLYGTVISCVYSSIRTVFNMREKGFDNGKAWEVMNNEPGYQYRLLDPYIKNKIKAQAAWRIARKLRLPVYVVRTGGDAGE